MTNNFIDLTIARVLGGDDNNNNSSDTPLKEDTNSLEGDGKEKKTALATPTLSNKKSRLLCDSMNITTPAASSEAPATTSSSAYGKTQAQLVGFSIPTWISRMS